MTRLLLLAVLLVGCAAREPALPALHELEVVGLEVTPACVERGAPFTVALRLRNPTASPGRAEAEVHALQQGRLAVVALDLQPGEEATAQAGARIGQAGSWSVYAAGGRVLAAQQTLRVVDPGAGGRC